MGIKVPKLFKKCVTMVQLSQFASCITHAIAALLFDTTPIFYNAVQVMYHIGMLYLFLPLLLKGYTHAERKAKSTGTVIQVREASCVRSNGVRVGEIGSDILLPLGKHGRDSRSRARLHPPHPPTAI